MASHRVFAAVLSLVFLPAGLASAADPDALVAQGIELRKQGREVDALAAFREAQALRPSGRARAQIGLTELALGQFLEAEGDLRGALAQNDDAWVAKNADALRAALAIVEDHLAWIVVESDVGSEIRLDGRLVGSAPLGAPARVVAGNVQVEVARKGELPARKVVSVGPRKQASVKLSLPPPAIVPEERPAPAPTYSALGAGLVGFGAAAIGAGAFFGVRALQHKTTRDAHCDSTGCDPDGLVADRQTRESALISTVGLVTGVISVAAGVVLIVRSRDKVLVQAALHPTVGGLALSGRF